jgi:hypothetical protein
MNGKIGGQRPRPRVALLGAFEADDMEHFGNMFPTLWQADDISSLENLVDVREIDLLVIASGITSDRDWSNQTHVICFSVDIDTLPGPISSSYCYITDTAETEEFLFPDATLPISRRREADYSYLTSVRGWPRIQLRFRSMFSANKEPTKSIFNNGAIICERHTNSPLAIAFLRENTNLGVAWLPNVDRNQSAWVYALVTQWAQSNKDAFPSFGEWTSSSEWMVPEETRILSQIQILEEKKRETAIKIDKRIGKLTTKLALAKSKADNGLRRLITRQGEELVDEVAKALSNIGFSVTKVDPIIGERGPKREDLRLRHLDKSGKEWNAIVEVRGYAHSGGKTSDLSRLTNRFADLYKKETGQAPNKYIYIVNSQIELLPLQRQGPLAPATEDLEVFGDSNGVLIWSIDLFQALKATDPTDYLTLLESIKGAKGRWVPVIAPLS